jgi:hypothetical protein
MQFLWIAGTLQGQTSPITASPVAGYARVTGIHHHSNHDGDDLKQMDARFVIATPLYVERANDST